MFLPYMGMVDILFNDAEPFEKNDNTPCDRKPNVKSDENWSNFQSRRRLKLQYFILVRV